MPFLREKIRAANPRLLIAMSCYLVLILVALFMLEGFLRNVVLFFFAILIIKTIAHSRDEELH